MLDLKESPALDLLRRQMNDGGSPYADLTELDRSLSAKMSMDERDAHFEALFEEGYLYRNGDGPPWLTLLGATAHGGYFDAALDKVVQVLLDREQKHFARDSITLSELRLKFETFFKHRTDKYIHSLLVLLGVASHPVYVEGSAEWPMKRDEVRLLVEAGDWRRLQDLRDRRALQAQRRSFESSVRGAGGYGLLMLMHPKVRNAAASTWGSGHFDESAKNALELIVAEAELRTGRKHENDAVGFFTRLLGPESDDHRSKKGSIACGTARMRLTDSDSLRSQQEGLLHLVLGFQKTFRNPYSHGTKKFTVLEAMDVLSLASRLLHFFDRCDVIGLESENDT